MLLINEDDIYPSTALIFAQLMAGVLLAAHSDEANHFVTSRYWCVRQ